MKFTAKRLFNRTSLYSFVLVLALFAVLPLSQQLLDATRAEMLMVRSVDIAPPPPPPPPTREAVDAGASVQLGLNFQALTSTVNLDPIATGASTGVSESLELGLAGFDLGVNTNATFTMEGIGFGIDGLDRAPTMLVRPTLRSGYMRRNGIDNFDVLLMVKWLKDGSLTLINIEEIQYPDVELAALVREAVSRIRYTKPTINGEPVERFSRLSLTIHAN